MSSNDRYVNAVLSVDAKYLDILFTVILLAFLGIQLWMTPRYARQAQLAPRLVGWTTLLILQIVLILQLFPSINDKLSAFTSQDIFDVSDRIDEDVDDLENRSSDREDLLTERKRVLDVVLWTLFLFATIMVVGFILGTLVFLILFYRYRVAQDWVRTIVYSLIVWIATVAVFDIVLNTPFYQGVLGVPFSF